MLDKPHDSPALGLELSSSAIRGAVLIQKSGRPFLQHIFEIPIDPEQFAEGNVKPLYMEGEEQPFYQLIEQSLIVTAISSRDVLVRPMQIKLANMRDIDSVLKFQTEPLIPFSIETAIVDRIKLSSQKEGTNLTIIAAEEAKIVENLTLWQAMNIEPEVVSCLPASLAAFSSLFSPCDSKYFVVHLQHKESTCVLVDQGKLLRSQTFTSDLNDPENLSKTLDRLMLSLGKGEVKQVLLTGDIKESLAKLLPSDVLVPHRTEQFSAPTSDLQKYAPVIGMALTALPGYRDQINFRQEKLAYPHPWKRIKKPLIRYIVSSLFVSAALFLLGNVVLSERLDELKKDYSSLLSVLHKPYSEFERQYLNKIEGRKATEDTTVLNPIQLSKEGLINRLGFLEKEMHSSPDYFALVPNTPRISDLFAWLSSHPHVKGDDIEGIALTSFSYKMTKRPDQTKKKEKYQIRVDMEFTAPNPTYAREFHDILLAPNEFVDPKQEIKWSTSRGKYIASFYLKDRTIYP